MKERKSKCGNFLSLARMIGSMGACIYRRLGSYAYVLT